MCAIQECRLIIFISDFKLDFSVPVELVLRLLQEILYCVESHGHLITFADVPYAPAYNRGPHTKPPFSLQQDKTNCLFTIYDQHKAFALLNPLKTCFSNKKVDMNSKKDGHKGPDWLGYSSTAAPHLRFQHCFSYTPSVLRQRSFYFYIHVNNFVNSIS